MKLIKPKPSLFYFRTESKEIQYSIDSFLTNLIKCVVELNEYKVFLIKYFDLTVTEFTVKKITENYLEIYIPTPLYYIKSHKNDQRYANRVVDLLSNFFPIEPFILHANHFNDHDIVKTIIARFQNFFLVTSIHSLILENSFNGNKKRMAEYIESTKYARSISFVNKEAALLQISNRVVTVNKYHKQLIEENYETAQDKIEIIHRGLDNFYELNRSGDRSQNLRSKYFFNEDDKIIIFAGRIDQTKGLKFLLQTLRHLLTIDKHFKLIIAGGGIIEDLLSNCKDIWSKITFTGFVDKDYLSALFQIADIGVLPAIYDNDSIIAKMMISNNLPMIVSDCEGFREFFVDGETCLVVKNHYNEFGEMFLDPTELANQILWITKHKSRAAELSENALRLLMVDGDFNATFADYYKIYQQYI